MRERGRRRRVGSAAAPWHRRNAAKFGANATSTNNLGLPAVCLCFELVQSPPSPTHVRRKTSRASKIACSGEQLQEEESAIVNLDPKAIINAALDPKGLISGAAKLAERAGDEACFAALCVRSGLVGPEPPQRVAQLLLGFQRYGLLGGAVVAGAARHGDRAVIIDERGELSYKELDERTNALANAWREHGLEAGEGVAILARNHRGFLEAVFAAAKCGARIVLLNTSFAGPQIREVAGREGTDLLVYDEEYAEMLEGVQCRRGRFRAWTDGPTAGGPPPDSIEALIAESDDSAPPKP